MVGVERGLISLYRNDYEVQEFCRVGVLLETTSNAESADCVSSFPRDIEEGCWVTHVTNGAVQGTRELGKGMEVDIVDRPGGDEC